MAQLTVRLDESLVVQVKAHAARLGRSVNSFVAAVLEAAVNPDYEDSDAARTRARLEQAGLLAGRTGRPRGRRADRRRVEEARRAAGTGTLPSRLISDGRG